MDSVRADSLTGAMELLRLANMEAAGSGRSGEPENPVGL
jgi:hypothetical protein